jgi:hypothetical protein
MRAGQACGRPHRRRRAGLRAMPPLGTRPAPVRGVRQDRPDRGARPRRPRRHLRELLPDAHGCLQRVRQTAGMQPRRHPEAGLRVVRATGHSTVRAVRGGSPASGPVGGRPALRSVLHRRAPPSGNLPGVRVTAAAGLAAWTRGYRLRRLRRDPRQPRLHGVRPGRQALREGPVRPVQPAPPRHRAAVGRDRAGPCRVDRHARCHHRDQGATVGAELAAQGRRSRAAR